VRSWLGLIEYASELQAPSEVIPPISQLPIYPDGVLCQLDAAYPRAVTLSQGGNWSQG
jgi:hypothetical protein